MVGLKNNSQVHIMTQLYKLFKEQDIHHSVDAYTNWDNVKRICLQKNEHFNNTKLEELIAYRRFITVPTHKVSSLQCDILSLKLDAYRIVFIDGYFVPGLSDKNTGLWQIKVKHTKQLPTPIKSEFFLHIIEILNNEITDIHLPAGKTAKKPLYLLHISKGSDNKESLNTIFYRHNIDMAAGSNGNVIEHFVSIDNKAAHFSGARTTINLSNNAQLNHIKLAFENRTSYHFSHNDLYMGQAATMRSSAFILGSGFTLHQTSVKMNGDGADLSINSLLFTYKNEISDIRTYLEHNKSYCISRQLHKIIACDHSKGVFNGLVKVARNVFKIDGKITNNNLIIGKLAKVYTKPHLEIYNSDVKCSHGATVGHLDKEQIFYLCSRGIPILEAKRMIIATFTAEVIDKIGNDTNLCKIISNRITEYLKKIDIAL